MKTEKEREFTFSATFSLQSLFSDLKVPSITNRFSFDSKSYLVYGMKTYPTSDSPLKVFFTLQRLSSALAQKQYRIGLLFRYKKGDFGTISVTERSCAAPISQVESHIQVFRERLSENMCTPQSGKVMWDMFNTLFLTLQLSNLLLFLSFSTRKHTPMTSPVILSNFFEEQ